MYTIRHTLLGNIRALFMAGNSANSPSENSSSAVSVDDLLKQAREKLALAGKHTDSLVASRDVQGGFFSTDSVKAILDKVAKLNTTNKQKIKDTISEARKTLEWSSPEKKAILNDLEKSFAADFKAAETSNDKDKKDIKASTNSKTDTLATKHADTRTNERKFQDTAIKIEKKDEKITKDSMVALLADFDGMSGVEVENRSVLRQALFGGGKQKEVVGEAQVYELLSRMDAAQLNATYIRVTGDSSGLPWTSPVYREGASRYDLEFAAQKKIVRFQRELADQASMMADMSEVFLGQGARMGLQSVVEGRTDALKAAIADPKKLADFQKMITDSKVMERDPNFMTKAISFLIKLGIQVPLAIMSKGVLGAYVESQDIIVDKSKDGKINGETKGSLTVARGSDKEVSATVDLLGARVNLKGNSPTARITAGTNAIINSTDLKKDIAELVLKINKEFETTDKEGKKAELYSTVVGYSTSYLKRMIELVSVPSLAAEKQKEIIANLTMSYLSRVEAAKGSQLEGVFASFGASGAMLGVSGGRVDTAATFSGVREGSARVEANVGERKMTAEELSAKLTAAKVNIENGEYTLLDGKKVKPTSNQEIQWKIIEHLYDDRIVTEAIPTLIEKKAGTAGKDAVTGSTLEIKRENKPLERISLPDDKMIADYLLMLRRTKGNDMKKLSIAISNGEYESAKTQAQAILKGTKDKTGQALLVALNDKNQDNQSFLTLWREKTSGGTESRAIAAKIISGTPQNIEKYYEKNKLPESFGSQYGLSSAEVTDIIKSYGSLDKSQVSTLGAQFKNGFHALVAYAQKNGQGAEFSTLGTVTDTGAQYIGVPKLQTGAVATKFLTKIEISLKPADLAEYKKSLPDTFKDTSDEEMKQLVVYGKLPASMILSGYSVTKAPTVYTYLSFSEHAECFNLGVALTSPGIKAPDTDKVDAIPATGAEHTISTGSVVGKNTSHHFEIGIGGGFKTSKPEKQDEVKEPVKPIDKPGTPIPTPGPSSTPGTTVTGPRPAPTPDKPIVNPPSQPGNGGVGRK